MSDFHFKTESRETTKLQWLLAKLKVLFGKNMQLFLGTKEGFLWHFCFNMLHAGVVGGHNVVDLIQTLTLAKMPLLDFENKTYDLNPSVLWLYLIHLLWQSNPILWLHVCSFQSLFVLFFSLVFSAVTAALKPISSDGENCCCWQQLDWRMFFFFFFFMEKILLPPHPISTPKFNKKNTLSVSVWMGVSYGCISSFVSDPWEQPTQREKCHNVSLQIVLMCSPFFTQQYVIKGLL